MIIQRSRAASEEAEAATRLTLGLSAAVGGVAGGIGLVANGPTAWLVIPTLVLLLCLVAGRPRAAAWAAMGVWVGLLPHARVEAMLGPLAMVVACAAIALGPGRLAELVVRDWRGVRSSDAPLDAGEGGWIEEV